MLAEMLLLFADTHTCVHARTHARTHQHHATTANVTACLKDLQRFLRRDDPTERPAYMKLGELAVVENDVIPLILTHPTDTDLVYNARACVTAGGCGGEPVVSRGEGSSGRLPPMPHRLAPPYFCQQQQQPLCLCAVGRLVGRLAGWLAGCVQGSGAAKGVVPSGHPTCAAALCAAGN